VLFSEVMTAARGRGFVYVLDAFLKTLILHKSTLNFSLFLRTTFLALVN
jgi:hypothetical protein